MNPYTFRGNHQRKRRINLFFPQPDLLKNRGKSKLKDSDTDIEEGVLRKRWLSTVSGLQSIVTKLIRIGFY